MKVRLIVTHPGSAHFDEVTAISLILAVHSDFEFRVERREPSLTELDDSSVWVVDTGNRHEPEKLNFDHHQSLECPASFVLVAEYLGLLGDLAVMPWWNFKDSVDRVGPVNASAKYKAGDDLVNRNPMENWLVDKFAADPQKSLPLLRDFGKYMIEDARRLRTQIDFWKNSRRLIIAGVPAMIGETRESYGLEEFRRLVENPPDIVISRDRRSEGWRLYRYEGTPVDFSLISKCAEIEFAHKTGFLAKTRESLSIDELIALISKAVIRRP
jgi:hypothetical protein